MQTDVNHPVALALSGGGDSMALLAIAAAWARTRGRRLLAITVDHGLNPASADWSRRCERAAADVEADWIERRWQGDKPATGLTAAARVARHGLIAEAAREAGARAVLFAHTADDIAEGDWMRERGSTLGALREWSPSPAWPQGRGLMLLRPLLAERREALRAGLRDAGAEWIEDPANSDVRFARSRARSALLLLGEGGSAIAETDEGRVSTIKREPLTLSGSAVPFGSRKDDRIALVRSIPLPLGEGFKTARNISASELAATLLCASGRSEPPRGERLQRLADRLHSGEDFTATLSGARIEAIGAEIVIGREPGEFRRRPSPDVRLDPGQPAVWDGRFEITARQPGWTVTSAAGRLNRLSDADRRVAATVPAWARAALPVLIRDGVDALVLAWRQAEVRVLAPRRLALFRGAVSGGSGGVSGDETTQEADLARTMHGETPPPDLFS